MKNDEYMNNNQELPLSDDSMKEAIGDEAARSEDNAQNENPFAEVSDVLNIPARLGAEENELSLSEENDSDTEDSYQEDVSIAFSDDKETENGKDEDDAEESSSYEEPEAIEKSEALNVENQQVSAKKEEKPRRVDSIFDFIELFVFTLAAVFIITSFFFRYSIVDGKSMQNTLQDNERLILSDFLYNPKPGDVVVIDDRTLNDPIVKRVIAVEGQTVKFTRYGVWVDGELLNEDYVYIDSANFEYSVDPCKDFIDNSDRYNLQVGNGYYEITVPENEIFVMGDHRNDSKDSRMTGTYHEDSVLGKVVFRFYPFDQFGKIE